MPPLDHLKLTARSPPIDPKPILQRPLPFLPNASGRDGPNHPWRPGPWNPQYRIWRKAAIQRVTSTATVNLARRDHHYHHHHHPAMRSRRRKLCVYPNPERPSKPRFKSAPFSYPVWTVPCSKVENNHDATTTATKENAFKIANTGGMRNGGVRVCVVCMSSWPTDSESFSFSFCCCHVNVGGRYKVHKIDGLFVIHWAII